MPTRPPASRRLMIALAVMVLIAAGCSSHGADHALGTRPRTTPSTTGAKASTAALPSSELARGLLGPEDVERNWVRDAGWTGQVEVGSACLGGALSPGPGDQRASRAFTAGPGGPIVFVETLTSYPAADGSAVERRAVAALKRCPVVDLTVDGHRVSASIHDSGPLPVGSRAEAFDARATTPPWSASAAVIQVGGVIAVIAYLSTAGPDPSTLLSYARRAAAKLNLL